jgi:hypothetical protein
LAYLKEQNLHSELQRKAMTRMMGLTFKIVYKQGKDNLATDALSRVAQMLAAQAVSVLQPQWIQEVLNSYATDPQAQELLTQLAIQSPNEKGFSLDNGLIRKGNLIWIGSNLALQTRLITTFHSSPIGGHSGVNATYHRLKQNFTWKGMRSHIDSYIKQCAICQHTKHSHQHPTGLL